MKNDFWNKLKEEKEKMKEIPLQNFGRYSLLYREIASYFKVFPFKILIFSAIIGTLVLFYLLGPFFIQLASFIGGGF